MRVRLRLILAQGQIYLKPLCLTACWCRQYDNPHESRMGYMPRNILIANNSFVRGSRCVPDPYHAGTA